MHYLYGKRRDGSEELVAKFGSEAQLRAYVNYATLRTNEDGTQVFEQQTPLTGCVGFRYATELSDEGDAEKDVPLNPSPTML